jgi:hypothetical protein
MDWQDIVFGLGSIIFIVSLLPTIFSDHKPSLWTSVPTSLTQFAFAITYLSIDYEFAFVTTFASATLWDIIAIQTIYLYETRPEKRGTIN